MSGVLAARSAFWAASGAECGAVAAQILPGNFVVLAAVAAGAVLERRSRGTLVP